MKIYKKRREHNHREQQAGQQLAPAERGPPESARKQGRGDKTRQVIVMTSRAKTGPRNGDHLCKAPVAAAAGPAGQRSAAAAHPTVPTAAASTAEQSGWTADLHPIDALRPIMCLSIGVGLVYARRVDPLLALDFGLSSHRHSSLSLLFSSHFIVS